MVSICQLCMRDGDKLGELIVIDAKTVHLACLIFSSHVWVNPRSLPIKDVETLDALRSLTSDMNSSLDYNMPYDKCCSFIMGFDKVVKTTPLCHLCSTSGASIKCSVLDCERSFHLPCLIAYNRKVDQSYFIFHAKMVYYPGDNILRPGSFLLCKHHKAWDTDTIWSSLKSYILGRTDLRDSISIDVDTLPLNMQKAALKASSISIFNPEEDKYQIIDENMRTFKFKNLNGAILDIPRGNYISWNFDWEAERRNITQTMPLRSSQLHDNMRDYQEISICMDNPPSSSSSSLSLTVSSSAVDQKEDRERAVQEKGPSLMANFLSKGELTFEPMSTYPFKQNKSKVTSYCYDNQHNDNPLDDVSRDLDITTLGHQILLEDSNSNRHARSDDTTISINDGCNSSSSKIEIPDKSENNLQMNGDFLNTVSDPILSILSEHSAHQPPGIHSSRSLQIPPELSDLKFDPEFHQKLFQVKTQTQTTVEIIYNLIVDRQELLIKDGSVTAIDLAFKLLEKHLDKYKKLAILEAGKEIIEKMESSEPIESPEADPVLAAVESSSTPTARSTHDGENSNNDLNNKDQKRVHSINISEEIDGKENTDINNNLVEDDLSYWDSDNADYSDVQKDNGRCIRESTDNADRNNDDSEKDVSSVTNNDANHVDGNSNTGTSKSTNDGSRSVGSHNSNMDQSLTNLLDNRNELEAIYGYCGVCAGQEEGPENCSNKMLVCKSCGVRTHVTCTDGYGTYSANGTWQCALCLSQDATQCCLCQTKSSQLLSRPTYHNCGSWVHSVCLHGNWEAMSGEEEVDAGVRRQKQRDREDSQDSDTLDDSDDSEEEEEEENDSDDDGKCKICNDDDPTNSSNRGRFVLQKVKCSTEGCQIVFHMSCAWLKGYEMEKVDSEITREDVQQNLIIPIEYRINVYCMDHSESKNLVNREKVDRRVSDSVGVKQDVNKKQACKKKSLSQSAVQSPSSAVDSGGLKVDESGNESDGNQSVDSIEEYYLKAYRPNLYKDPIQDTTSGRNMGGRPRSGSYDRPGRGGGRGGGSHNRSPKSLLPTSTTTTATAATTSTPTPTTSNKKIPDAPRILKSASDLKNPNLQEEFKILRQIRIAEEKRREEESRGETGPTTTVATPSLLFPNPSTTPVAAVSAMSSSSSIDANESKVKSVSKKHPIQSVPRPNPSSKLTVSASIPVPSQTAPQSIQSSKPTISAVKHVPSLIPPQPVQSSKPLIPTVTPVPSRAVPQPIQSSKPTILAAKQIPSQFIPQPAQSSKPIIKHNTMKARDLRVSSVQDFDFYSSKSAIDLEKSKERERLQGPSKHSQAQKIKMRDEKKSKKEDEGSGSDDSVVILSPLHSHSAAAGRKKEDSSTNNAKGGSRSNELHRNERSIGQKPHTTNIQTQEQSRTESGQPKQVALNSLSKNSHGTTNAKSNSPNVDKIVNQFNESYNRHSSSTSKSISSSSSSSSSSSTSKTSSSSSSRKEREYGIISEKNSDDRSMKGGDLSSSSKNERVSGKRKERSEIEGSKNENIKEAHTNPEGNEAPSHHVNKEGKPAYPRTNQSSDLSEHRRSTQSSNPHPHPQHRPRCRFYNKSGGCQNGDRCKFRHVDEDHAPSKKPRRD